MPVIPNLEQLGVDTENLEEVVSFILSMNLTNNQKLTLIYEYEQESKKTVPQELTKGLIP